MLLLVSGCSGLSGMSGTGGKNYVSGDGSVQMLAAHERGKPVVLQGTDLDNHPLDVASLRGKPVVVNVWGAWCPDCRAEASELVAAAHRLGSKAHFVGIDVRDPSTDTAKAYERTFKVPYPSLYSPDGQALLSFSGTLTPSTIPATVVLDAQGRVAASIIGAVPSTTTLVQIVQDVADGRTGRVDG